MVQEVEVKTESVDIAKARSRAVIAFILASILIDTLGFGIIIPVLPPLVVSFVGNTATGAEIYGLFGTAWALMQFIFSPFLGALSDRFGRRPVLIMSAIGVGLDYILMAWAPTLAWLFLGRVISGITSAGYATAAAYVADVTPPERRAGAYGMIGVAWGIGFIVGPAIGGLLGTFGPRVPFWGAAVLSLVSASYGFFILPESLAPALRSKFSIKRANPIGSLGLLRSRPGLAGLASVNFLNFLAFQVLPSVFVLYAGYRFGWGPAQVGIALALVGVFNILVQGFLIRPFIARYGEQKALLTGLFSGAASFILYGLAPNEYLFLGGVVLFAPIGLAGPAIQSLMTRRVSPTEQGQLQGANASIMGLTGVIGPSLFTFVFALFISGTVTISLPGAPFLLAALLMLAAVLLAFQVTRSKSPVESDESGPSLPDALGSTATDN